jgi:membrane protein DedA with SNARE-associated domain
MDAPALIERYGYLALVVGTFFEGEVALLFAGYAARGGHLALAWVMCCGALGVFISDWVCFLLGRFCSRALFRRFPALRASIAAPLARIERHPGWFIIAFQFIPGTSTVTPIAIGVSRISAWRFLALDLAGIAVWTTLFALLGYLCGAALGLLVDDLHRYDAWLIALFIAVLLLVWWRRLRSAAPVPTADAAGPPPGSATREGD